MLAELGHQKDLAVIVQSNGGFADDSLKMANLLHEFADEVTFVVPFYAKSAATDLCLSGKSILMGPISELGPTDPMMSVDERLITPTLPEPLELPGEPKERTNRQMAAHTLRDFLTAAGVLRDDGTYDPEVLSVYMNKGILNPFLLGEFERATKRAVQYTETNLQRHMFKDHEQGSSLAAETAKKLCEGYYDHGYPIGRKEARDVLHLNVDDMSDEQWQRTSDLMLAYDKLMEAQNIATLIETAQGFQITHWPSV